MDHSGHMIASALPLKGPDLKTLPVVSCFAGSLQTQLHRLIKRIDPGMRPTMTKIFADLVGLLDYLSLADSSLREGNQVSEPLHILEIFRGDAQALINFIETRVMRADEITILVFDTLDSTVFAIRHDLKRIFESELIDCSAVLGNDRLTRGKIMAALGILANCLQQSTISLARLFDSTLTGAQLFDDYVTRLVQSQILCKDLEALIQLAGEADERTYFSIANQLRAFQSGSMQYLMYKDWEEYERLMNEVIASIQSRGNVPGTLKSLSCYLSTLLSHVRARAVLTDQDSRTDRAYQFAVSKHAQS
jgi:hypothetical protein